MNNTRTFIVCVVLMLALVAFNLLVTSIDTRIFFAPVAIFIIASTWGAVDVSSQFFLPTTCKGDSSEHVVAITFDDGPSPGKTERVLDILKEFNVPATFFCIGKNVAAHPNICRRIRDEGHLVGNHSYHHGALFDLQSTASITTELSETNRAIRTAIDKTSRFFRPPYGVTNPMLARAVKKERLRAVGWSVRSLDTVARDKEVLLRRIMRRLRAGDIILLHDRCEITVEILPELLMRIHSTGLKVIALDKLIGEKAYE